MNTFNTFEEALKRAKEINDNESEPVNIEDAKLYFHNFDGKPKFGRQATSGNIEYGVYIDNEEFAERLAREGWDIRVKEYEDGNKRYYIKCIINFEPIGKDGSIIDKFVPTVYVYVEGSDSMTQITSKEEMAMYENDPNRNTKVDVVSVDCKLRAKAASIPDPHIVAYTRHVVFTVRIIEQESNANLKFNKFSGIKGYVE